MRTSRQIPFASILLFIAALFFILTTCSDDEDEARVLGCDSFEYQGVTYVDSTCRTTGWTNYRRFHEGPTFEVTCKDGCISSARKVDVSVVNP